MSIFVYLTSQAAYLLNSLSNDLRSYKVASVTPSPAPQTSTGGWFQSLVGRSPTPTKTKSSVLTAESFPAKPKGLYMYGDVGSGTALGVGN